LIGTEIKGAQRWLHLPGFSLQPSEIMKPTFAIFIAWLLARQQEQPLFPGMILAVVCYGVFASLLILQPDFGMTFVLTLMIASQIFLAGLPFRILVGIILAGIVGIILAYNVLGHVQNRIDRFLDPATGDNYQIDKSIEAFQYGGLWGTGPGQGVIKNRIPDAHADFIFSVGAEEGGFIFVMILLALYTFVIYRILRHLLQSQHMFVILACGGLLMMFTLQTLIHMGSALHLIPTKGMTLPFISYGGTSLLSMGLSFGVILALTRRRGMGTSTRMGLSAREPERPVSP
jgi:cell division protein FtsW